MLLRPTASEFNAIKMNHRYFPNFASFCRRVHSWIFPHFPRVRFRRNLKTFKSYRNPSKIAWVCCSGDGHILTQHEIVTLKGFQKPDDTIATIHFSFATAFYAHRVICTKSLLMEQSKLLTCTFKRSVLFYYLHGNIHLPKSREKNSKFNRLRNIKTKKASPFPYLAPCQFGNFVILLF